MRTQSQVSLITPLMGHNAAKHLVGICIDDPRRTRVFLGFLRVKLIVVAIRESRELQEVVVILAHAVLAVLRGTVTVGFTELNGRSTLDELPIPVVAVGEPMRVAATSLAVGERRVVRVALGFGLIVEKPFVFPFVCLGIQLLVDAGPGLWVHVSYPLEGLLKRRLPHECQEAREQLEQTRLWQPAGKGF